MAMLGLRFCARALPSCGKWGPLFIAVRGPLTITASLVVEHRLQMRRLSNCGSRAQPLRGMWDPPRPGLEPVSPALAGRLPTTVPPGKPLNNILYPESYCMCPSTSVVCTQYFCGLFTHFLRYQKSPIPSGSVLFVLNTLEASQDVL